MSANKRIDSRHAERQTGAALVEFALISFVLFAVLFAVLEVAHAIYLWNTLQEVTRRAASAATATDFSDQGAMDRVRQGAIFRTSSGTLLLGKPVTDAHVRIDYLSLARDGNGVLTLTPLGAGLLPACPARNMLNCTADPYGNNCIRFVRVRICAADGDASTCNAVPYSPFTLFPGFTMSLPTATAIVKAGALGYQAGDAMCP
jgi:hypothetical protein